MLIFRCLWDTQEEQLGRQLAMKLGIEDLLYNFANCLPHWTGCVGLHAVPFGVDVTWGE